jgi:hypothetical protein
MLRMISLTRSKHTMTLAGSYLAPADRCEVSDDRKRRKRKRKTRRPSQADRDWQPSLSLPRSDRLRFHRSPRMTVRA